MASGVPIAAAALLLTKFVSTPTRPISAASTQGGGQPPTPCTNACARKPVAPVTVSASPSARLAATISTTLTDSEPPTSRQASVRVPSSTSTPTRALSAIGTPPKLAEATTPASVSSATTDLPCRGSARRSSSSRPMPSRCIVCSDSAAPCSRITSPASTR